MRVYLRFTLNMTLSSFMVVTCGLSDGGGDGSELEPLYGVVAGIKGY